jgi:hypothetical protein
MKRVAVLLILVASACGGATVPSTSSTIVVVDPAVGQTSIEDAALSVVAAIVAVHGEDGALDAFFWASERGYSGVQLISAALDGRLAADGLIADAAGVTEAPAGSPLGLIELPEAEIQGMGAMAMRVGNRTSSVMPTRLHQISIEELDRLEAAELETLTAIVFAIFGGYTLEQIVLNILEGGVFDTLVVPEEVGDSNPCPILVDSTGQTIVPEEDEYERRLIESPNSAMSYYSELCHSDIRSRADAERSEREQTAQEEAGTSTSSVPSPPTETIDGVYTLDISAAWLDIDVSGNVLQSEMRLEVIDDAVAAFDYVFVHTDLASVTGSKGVVLCRADATLKMTATYLASFTDGLALIPVLYEASQTAGRPTEDGSADDCDDASMLSAPLEAQVSAGMEGVMTVQILNGGSPVGAPIELNR